MMTTARWATIVALCWLPTAASAAEPERVWGTYVGDSGHDFFAAVALDPQGNLYAVGRTNSLEGIATDGAHKPAPEGTDGFLVKFSPAGERLWGTYFGGEGIESVDSLAVADGVVVIGGTSASATGIATPGAFQSELPGGASGFLATFTADGELVWGTYVGGSEGMTIFRDIVLDPQGAIYAVGATEAPIAGLTSDASHQPTFYGAGWEDDGVLAKFDPQGKLLWGTYYGDKYNDVIECVSIGPTGELYIAGNTDSQANIATEGAHKPTLSVRLIDAFLARFDADGKRLWGTYYGADQQLESFSCVVALPQGGAALVGHTKSTSGIATPGTHQEQHAGEYDAYIARFDASGQRLWGTYYGGAGEEVGGINVATDALGHIYLSTGTTSLAGIATENALVPMAPGGMYDVALARFDGQGQRRWGTYYGGSGSESRGFLAVTAGGEIYVGGGTSSADGIASPGAFDTSHGGGVNLQDGYLARLTQTLGLGCDDPGDCASGHCVDGVCCDSACGEGAVDCQACSVAEGAPLDGTCVPLGPTIICRPAAADACDVPETCDGVGLSCPDDMTLPDGEACDGGECQAGQCVPDGLESTSSGGDTTTTDSPTTTDSSATTDGPTTTDGSDTTGHAPEDSSGGATGTAGSAVDTGCGCRGAPGSSGLPALLALLLLRRRARRGG